MHAATIFTRALVLAALLLMGCGDAASVTAARVVLGGANFQGTTAVFLGETWELTY